MAAVQRYVVDEIPRHRVGELVGACGDDLDRVIDEYRDRVAGDIDGTESEGAHSPVVRAVAAVDAGLGTLVRGAANAGVDGLDSEVDVIRTALRWYCSAHDSLRHAATAERYARLDMSTGFAAEMADVRKGGEIEAPLRERGVRPRVGPASDSETRRREREAARPAFGKPTTRRTTGRDADPVCDSSDRDAVRVVEISQFDRRPTRTERVATVETEPGIAEFRNLFPWKIPIRLKPTAVHVNT